MRKRNIFFLLLLFFTLLFFFPLASWSQLVLGQYEDEAPFRTWNTLGIKTASSLGMGEIQFTLATDCSVALSNPALLTELPKITFSFNSSYHRASFFKYSIVNTGVLFSEKTLTDDFTAFDFIGISLRLSDWTFALNWSLLEVYDRPVADYQYMFQDTLYYSIYMNQQGRLNNLNFSLSRKLSKILSVGLGFNRVYGQLDREIIEVWAVDRVSISDNKSHEYSGYYFNAGLFLDLTDRFKVAAVFRTPYVKKSESQSVLSYNAPPGGTDITIEASSNDEYHQPLVLGFGASYQILKDFRVMSELTYFNWSKYEADYFGEIQQRDYKDVIKIGVGAEMVNSFTLFNQDFYLPWRAGFSYDPQPMKEPNSHYVYFTFGSGIHWKGLHFDTAVSIGRESGSGDALSTNRIAFSLSYQF
jgi:hypothetical protein